MKNRILTFLLLCLSSIVNAQDITHKNGLKLVFFDEFDYQGLPDSTKWVFEEGFVRNEEPQYYTKNRLANCRVENGCLVIETRKEQFTNPVYHPDSANWKYNRHFAQYTSASINTKGKYWYKYGRIEVRAKVPSGLGTWPAIWMLGDNKKKMQWPRYGEIDIMEFLGKDSTVVYGTVHYSDSVGQMQHRGEAPVVGKPADGFHVYAVEWNKKQIVFYYDSLKYFVFDYKKAKANPGNIFKKKFYLLLNMALGHQGSWAGAVDDAILPAKFYIDYVRVYQ